jgi:hypothetical protein
MKEKVGGIVVVIVAVVALSSVIRGCDERDVKGWADQNSYDIRDIEERHWDQGKFNWAWDQDEDARVYRVEVTPKGYPDAKPMVVWVRLGNSPWSGVETRWDEKTR